ncbi:MAG TPA: DUF5686 family protein, partial [Tangfeifania sp.]|nr:DUF5686 family protein [Tangfeifania sp.]
FRSLGYLQVEKEINLASDSLYLDIEMEQQNFEIKEVLIFPGEEDPAYYIVRKAMAKAAYYREKIKHYEADLYIKSNFTFTNIPRLYKNKLEINGQKMKDVMEEDRTYVIESHNKITFDYPQKYKQEVISKRTSLVGFDEPPVMGLITSSFYESRPNQVISPLSALALNHYNYQYEGFISSGNFDVFKIKVEPKRKSDELVSGYMYIVDKLWCLYSVDFKTSIEFFNYQIKQQYENLGNENWLPVSHLIDGDFSIFGLRGKYYYGASLKYQNIEENVIAGKTEFTDDTVKKEIRKPDEKEVELREKVAEITAKEELTNRDVKKVARLNRKILKEQYQDTTIIPPDPDSYEMEDKADTLTTERTYWDSVRTIPLTPAEMESYELTDSLRTQNIRLTDSTSNETGKSKSWLAKIGTGHYDFCEDSLVRFGYKGLINPDNFDFNAVDGYKLKQQFSFAVIPDSGKSIRMEPEIGYAFSRKSLFWRIDTRFDLWENNRIELDFGKESRDFKPTSLGISPALNDISSWFFAENYMKLYETEFLNLDIRQRLKKNWTFYAKLGYNHYFPLENNATYLLSDKKEYSPNVPFGLTKNSEALNQQKSFTYELAANYRKYRPKPWLEKSNFLFISDYYGFRISFKQGVKSVFASVSDFSQIDVKIYQQANLSPVAGIDWHINAGTFLHADQLHFSQYKHFQTAEIPVSFQSFTQTFQLLNDYEPSTAESYLAAGTEFRTEYLLLRYLSVLNRRTWSESLHLNYLTTPALKNYWETGYSLNSLFFVGNIGVFAGFRGSEFDRVMVKFSISGL